MGVALVMVMQPDPWMVTVLVVSLAILFLWQDIEPDGGRAKPGGQGES